MPLTSVCKSEPGSIRKQKPAELAWIYQNEMVCACRKALDSQLIQTRGRSRQNNVRFGVLFGNTLPAARHACSSQYSMRELASQVFQKTPVRSYQTRIAGMENYFFQNVSSNARKKIFFYGEAVFWAEVKSEGCTFKCFLQSYKRSCSV